LFGLRLVNQWSLSSGGRTGTPSL